MTAKIVEDRLSWLDHIVLAFGSHAAPNGEACVIWTGAKNEDGYGIAGQRPLLLAHRLAYRRAFGPIPEGMLVCHSCDNPPCVNPAHLFLGTVADNNRDRHRKGRSKNLFPAGDAHPARQRSGERHWCARLSDVDVADIRRRRAAGETCRSLGVVFGVHEATISRISRGIWRPA